MFVQITNQINETDEIDQIDQTNQTSEAKGDRQWPIAHGPLPIAYYP